MGSVRVYFEVQVPQKYWSVGFPDRVRVTVRVRFRVRHSNSVQLKAPKNRGVI